VKGPTSLINSVLKYDHRSAGSGFIFQVKFDKKDFCTEKGKESFIGLAKTYFAGGGQQITATVVSPDELLDAVENPDRHRNLIVRVGGFSGYFVELADEIQQSVIKRTFAGI
jgi:formate C-acetyltransferase